MNESASRKRNRSDNFDVDDVELLISLVNEHSDMLDSPKIETKKEGWDNIHTKFNANCTGIKRDLAALKSKMKNLKAQTKKANLKLEVSQQDPLASSSMNGNENGNDTNDDDEYEMDVSQNEEDTKPLISHCSSNGSNKIRKRCKKFTKEECDLLLSLHDKYCKNLDTSSTANSVKKRQDAWDNLTYEFNELQTSGIIRECNELKIKFKNIKALKVKTESIEPQTVLNNIGVFNESDSSGKVTVEDRKILVTRPIRTLQNHPPVTKTFGDLANSTATNDLFYDDDDYEEDFNRGNHKQTSHEDKEVEKIRRENILLKNAVLRKKERLLELQIALAERNLRRQL